MRMGALIFCLLVCAGQLVFSFSASINNYYVALVGRFIFGLGGESLSVAQSAFTAKWFTGKELAFAFAITISTSRIGSAVNFNVSPAMEQKYGVPFAIWFGTILCGVSLLAAIALIFIDKIGDRLRNEKMTNIQQQAQKDEEKIKLWDVTKFPASLFLIYAIVVAFYVSVFIYITIGTNIIDSKWPEDKARAGTILGLPYTISAVASPVFGLLVELTGRNLWWMIAATGLQTVVHGLLSFIVINKYIPWVVHVMMGLAYSGLAASLWPSITLLLPLKYVGTAYGLAFALQNLGLAVFPEIIGGVLNATHNNYGLAEYIFLGCAATSCFLCVCLLVFDARNPRLNLSGAAIRAKALLKENTPDESERTPLHETDEKTPLVKHED